MLTLDSLSAPPDYFPLAHGRYDVVAGLKPLGDKPVFQIDRHYGEYLAAKAASRREDPAKYYLTSGFAPGLQRAIAHHAIASLTREHPQAFTFDGRRFTNQLIGLVAELDLESLVVRASDSGTGVYAEFDFTGCDLFDFLALQTQEDWSVTALDAAGAEALRAIHLSFPNHWSPAEKIGRPFAEVHAPVAGIEPLVKAAPSLIATMIHKGPWERFAWGVATDTVLNHHPDNPDDPARTLTDYSPGHVGAHTHLRIERQTLTGFAEHRGALFTIRTYFTPVAELAGDRRAALASAVAGMSEAQLHYKGLTRLKAPLLEFLAAD